jgi:hypothetical protein
MGRRRSEGICSVRGEGMILKRDEGEKQKKVMVRQCRELGGKKQKPPCRENTENEIQHADVA